MYSHDLRRQKYSRFRGILNPPFDDHPSSTFPIFTTKQHFNINEYAAESANPNVDMFDHMIEAFPNELFLDIGCGFRGKTYENCLYIEVYPSRSADIIVDSSCTYPIRSNSCFGIGCFAVLEHTRRPWVVIEEMRRILKPGGRVFIDWPFLQPVHGYPSHFFNATREGLVSIFEDTGFSVNHAYTGPHQTAAYTIQWILSRFNHHLPTPELRLEFGELKVSDLVALSQQDPIWLKFLSSLSPEASSELACGNMLVATKAS